jgi:hypothetical protein
MNGMIRQSLCITYIYADPSGGAIQGMNTGIVDSNPTRDTDVCVRSVCV